MHEITYIDLFAGCGGLSLGLHNSRWKGLFAVEKSEDAFKTLNHNLITNCQHFNWPEWLPVQSFDVKELLDKYSLDLQRLKGKVDMIAGGPPCQGFSMAGQRNEDDERNQLVQYYLKFIEIIKPRIVFFENVKGFTVGFNNKTSKPYSDYIKEKLKDLGYKVDGKIIDFSEFGIPQRRQRFILIGSINSEPETFFNEMSKYSTKFLRANKLNKNITISDALSDLLMKHGTQISPDSKNFKAGIYGPIQSKYQRFLRRGLRLMGRVADSHRFPNHREETIRVFQNVLDYAPKNKRLDGERKTELNLNRRGAFLLAGNEVSPTITSNPDDYIHYSEPRILTVREYARIQSFPDWYEFKGKYTTGGERRVLEVPRYTQIGNAIPPLFSEQAGVVLREMILRERKGEV